MYTKRYVTILLVSLLVLAMLPVAAGAKGGPPGGGGETTAANNLSFPAIAVDGFAITPVPNPSFTVPYAGTYPGLTTDEIAYLQANGTWYPQKTNYQNCNNVDW